MCVCVSACGWLFGRLLVMSLVRSVVGSFSSLSACSFVCFVLFFVGVGVYVCMYACVLNRSGDYFLIGFVFAFTCAHARAFVFCVVDMFAAWFFTESSFGSVGELQFFADLRVVICLPRL